MSPEGGLAEGDGQHADVVPAGPAPSSASATPSARPTKGRSAQASSCFARRSMDRSSAWSRRSTSPSVYSTSLDPCGQRGGRLGSGADPELCSQRCRPALPEQRRAARAVDQDGWGMARAGEHQAAVAKVHLGIDHRGGVRRGTPSTKRSSRSRSSAGPESAIARARTALRSCPIAAAAFRPRPTTSPTTRAILSSSSQRRRTSHPHVESVDGGSVARRDAQPRVVGQRLGHHAALQGGGHGPLLGVSLLRVVFVRPAARSRTASDPSRRRQSCGRPAGCPAWSIRRSELTRTGIREPSARVSSTAIARTDPCMRSSGA